MREMETSNCLPQGFWDRILGRTVRPSGPSSLLSSIFWLLSPSSGLQWQSRVSLYGYRVTELGVYKIGKASQERDPRGQVQWCPKMQPPHTGTK